MERSGIPAGLAKARAADIARIPNRVLAKMTRADLANRLVAAGEFRRRARVPGLDADLFRYRLGLASEVLTTDDPKRAAELVKAAGVGVTIGTGRAARPAATGTTGTLRKAVPPRQPDRQLGPGQWRVRRGGGEPVVVNVPVLSGLASDSAKIIAKAANTGQLGTLAREIAAIDAAVAVKAAEYERKAQLVTDPELRQGYRELARREREKAGMA